MTRFVGAFKLVDTILDVVADRYGLTAARLRGPGRHRRVSHPRFIAMYTVRRVVGLSYPEIGKLFGGRDHSTVIYGCQRVEKRLKVDPTLSSELVVIAYLVAGRPLQAQLASPEQEPLRLDPITPEVAEESTNGAGFAGDAVEAAVDGTEPPVNVAAGRSA